MPELSRLQVKKNSAEYPWSDVGHSATDQKVPVTLYDSTGTEISIAKSFSLNHIDDATTADTVYLGSETLDGEWKILKIDQSGAFPVFTYASVTNNPTLTSYTTGWAGRVTATYNVYATAF